MAKIQQTWQRWIPGLLEKAVKRGETVESGAEVTKAALEFAIALGVLASVPSAPVVVAGLAFVGIGRKGLAFLHERTNQKFEIEEWVAFASPVAYINSFNALVERNVWLQEKLNAELKEQEVKPQFSQLGQLELDNSKAEEALKQFPKSILGQALNQELSTYLETKGIKSEMASLVTGWVAWDTYNYIKQLLSYESEDVRQTLSLLITAAPEIRATEKYASIESYLKEQISPSPSDSLLMERWKVIGEEFKITEIYVSLEAQLLDNNGEPKQKEPTVNLAKWVIEQLNEAQKNRQVIFIQAGPGRGKSVFCKMFADWVREHLHPIWTPILIRLRDIDTFERNIENTLSAAVRENFAKRNDWLSDRNTRYLFILDGFDELRLEGRTAKGIEDFLGQVGNYQAQTGCKHKFIVTGRESALNGIETRIPTNLDRVEITLMDDLLQEQWLSNWRKLVGQDKAEAFKKFLIADNCPERVQELAQEPLLLYLLAAMHRDNKLNSRMFEGVKGAQAKILIYQTTLDWVLTKQRPKDLNTTITEFDTEDLRLILIEAGLCITQSGREWTSIKTIESRLKGDKAIEMMLSEAQQRLGQNPLRNALAAFYLRPAKASEKAEGAVEFIHKSFGEFLCAQRFIQSFNKWLWIDPDSRHEDFLITGKQLSEEIYDLFSYGGLTTEIVDYLTALIDANGNFQLQSLFNRLEEFYLDWIQGKFINESSKNLPLAQMQKLQKQGLSIGLREVDIFTGLNVMILLLELHRYAQTQDELKDNVVFYPCGRKDSNNFDDQRLLRIIGYSNSVAVDAFSQTVGYFLPGANLDGANLRGANLRGANLSGANLRGANLDGANLRGANLNGANLDDAYLFGANLRGTYLEGANLRCPNLSGADLEGANLRDANLSGANLDGANLFCVNLRGANLSGANLFGANLSGANLESANLKSANLDGANLSGANLESANFKGANLDGANLLNITWHEHTNWKDVRGLDKARNRPESLLSQFNSTAHPSPPQDTPPSA
ncbi:MAG: pentapeptide repeat-containing protein [Nostoc sp.]